jgi:hypothetical protein
MDVGGYYILDCGGKISRGEASRERVKGKE